jgi:hypothetical protein
MLYLKNKFVLLSQFLERDSDITYKEEFHYIFITLKELFQILLKLK